MEDIKMNALTNLMSEEEFAEHLKKIKIDVYKDFEKGILHLRYFNGVSRFKSIRRAIRKGKCSIFGEVYPHRPFKNTNTKYNKERRAIYARLKHRNRVA